MSINGKDGGALGEIAEAGSGDSWQRGMSAVASFGLRRHLWMNVTFEPAEDTKTN